MAGTVPATNPVPAIALDGVSKSFDGGAHFALRDICLSIAPGDLVAMVGASGSGKTTLLKCINRLVEPDSGAILIHGRPAGDGRSAEHTSEIQSLMSISYDVFCLKKNNNKTMKT